MSDRVGDLARSSSLGEAESSATLSSCGSEGELAYLLTMSDGNRRADSGWNAVSGAGDETIAKSPRPPNFQPPLIPFTGRVAAAGLGARLPTVRIGLTP